MNSLLLIVLLLIVRQKKERKICLRRWWVHPINEKRIQFGFFHKLLPDLKRNPEKFENFFRMDLAAFSLLLSKLGPSIRKFSIRQPICPEERLMVTLRFLATGESYTSLSYAFRLGVSTISIIVAETCSVIHEKLAGDYLQTPRSSNEWQSVADVFWDKWNSPNTLGAIDGKHVKMRCPPRTGTLYYNYKGAFSTVLMAVCDGKYRCLYADVGSYGRDSDGGIFDRSAYKRAQQSGYLGYPEPKELPGTNIKTPFFLVGDGAFALSEHMMRPFPGKNLSDEERIFNYRLSRARRLIENFFGILVAKWRCLSHELEVAVENSDKIVLSILSLHNFLLSECARYDPGALADHGDNSDGLWRAQVQPLEALQERRIYTSASGREVREKLLRFYSGVGSVNWQNKSAGLEI